MEPTNLTFLIAGGCFIVVGQILVGVIGYFRAERENDRLTMVNRKLDAVSNEQVQTKHELNSRLTELVEAVRIAARASGILEGIEQQKKRASAGPDDPTDYSHSDLSDQLNKVGLSHSQTGMENADPEKAREHHHA